MAKIKSIHFTDATETTVIKWQDGTITKVKANGDDKYDRLTGFLIAYYKKHSGTTNADFGRLCDRFESESNIVLEEKNTKFTIRPFDGCSIDAIDAMDMLFKSLKGNI